MCWGTTPWSSIILLLLTLVSTAICGPQGYYRNEVNFVTGTLTTRDVILPIACSPAPWVNEIIYAGQKATDGRVVITTNNNANPPGIKITYTQATGYLYSDAHVYVGTGDIPTNNAGNPAPGQFPFKVENGYCKILGGGTSVECTIPYSAFGYDTSKCDATKEYKVAAHAAMEPAPGSGTSSQTGWAGGKCIIEPECKPWSKYFIFHFCCPKPEEPPEETNPPETPGCETAFGKVNPPWSYKTFDELGDDLPERWGWQNEVSCTELTSGISGKLFAGAGNGIGTYVGWWTAKLTNNQLIVVYSTQDTAWYMEGVHLDADTESIDNFAPGQYPYKDGHLTSVETYTFSISWPPSKCTGTVYLVLHADVCKGGAHKD